VVATVLARATTTTSSYSKSLRIHYI
jgi:hypothetical protein